MKKKFQYLLALALLLVFIMPTGYRFVHVIKHHSPFTITHTHIHKHHHAHDHECPSEENIPSKFNFTEYEAECPVVKYEIAVFDIGFNPKFTSNVLTPNIYFVLPEQKKSNHFKGKLFQLRAPPFCV